MKEANFVKMNATELHGAEQLLSIFQEVKFLDLSKIRVTDDKRADFVLEVPVQGKIWFLYCEVEANPRPSVARTAVRALANLLDELPSRRYGVLIMPLVSEQTRNICIEHGIGYADLSGNCLLSFDHVHIDRSGRARHREPSPKKLYPALFGTKSERMLRLLLRYPRQSWKVQELVEQAGISLGLASRIRGALMENGWAAAGGDGIHLTSPDGLLDAWRMAYQRPKDWQGFYTKLRGPDLQSALRAAFAEAGEGTHAILAGEAAAQWQAPYVTGGPTEIYADEEGTAALMRNLNLRKVPRGANVLIAQPKDDGVLRDRVSPAPGLWCTSPVQTYLDLATAGDRQGEAAEHLRRELLEPIFKSES